MHYSFSLLESQQDNLPVERKITTTTHDQIRILMTTYESPANFGSNSTYKSKWEGCFHGRRETAYTTSLLNHATSLALRRLRVCVRLFRVCTALSVYLSVLSNATAGPPVCHFVTSDLSCKWSRHHTNRHHIMYYKWPIK
jgi:hypothetical protein